MLEFLSKIFKIEKPKYPFDHQYRSAYNRVWINSLKNYTP